MSKTSHDKLLDRLLHILELNWEKIIALEEEEEEQGEKNGHVSPSSQFFPETVIVKHNDKAYAFDLGEQLAGIEDLQDCISILKENVEHWLKVDQDKQVWYDKHQEHLHTEDQWGDVLICQKKAWLGLEASKHPQNHNEDLSTTMGSNSRRLLRVIFQGQTRTWLDLDEHGDLLASPELDVLLRDNIEFHFNVPFEHQEVCDEYGRLNTTPDFRRALEGPNPTLKLFDKRGLTSLASPKEKVVAAAKELFDAIDTDHDGKITRKEWQEAPRIAPAPAPAEPASSSSSSPHVVRYVTSPGSSMFDAMDANHDGKITRTEFDQALGYPVTTISQPSVPGPHHYGLGQQGPGYHRPLSPQGFGSQQGHNYGQGRLEVHLHKEHLSDKFGLSISHCPDRRSLIIGHLQPTGLLGKWNRANPMSSLREGDTITAVNGISFDSIQMELQLERSRTVRLTGQRCGGGFFR